MKPYIKRTWAKMLCDHSSLNKKIFNGRGKRFASSIIQVDNSNLQCQRSNQKYVNMVSSLQFNWCSELLMASGMCGSWQRHPWWDEWEEFQWLYLIFIYADVSCWYLGKLFVYNKIFKNNSRLSVVKDSLQEHHHHQIFLIDTRDSCLWR